jgi:glycerophosphoryl diester phosphodiesterase
MAGLSGAFIAVTLRQCRVDWYYSFHGSIIPLMIRTYIAFVILLVSCQQNAKVPVPVDHWKLFDSSAATPLTISLRERLEGVYMIEQEDEFGPLAAFKWSYTVKGKDSVYHLSIFCEKDLAYFICEGKRLDQQILLDGYWRKMDNDETGKARFVVDQVKDSMVIHGIYGDDEDEPGQKINLKYLRPLYKEKPLEIVAHRGGGRNTDFLPASENSIELIMKAAAFGATGVEVDVQLTKDGVPVLYHDANINDRLTQKPGIHGQIEDYSYAELQQEIKLKKGEQIPSLHDVLDSIVHRTPLRYIWLDAKEKNSLPKLRELQLEFTQAAAAIGKKLEITIGIHDEKVLKGFRGLQDYRNIPSVCELDTADVNAINARIWAPLWVKGLQEDKVTAIHAQGRRVFSWTLDKPKQVREFMKANYDGVVSNYPSIVAYYYYTKEAPGH